MKAKSLLELSLCSFFVSDLSLLFVLLIFFLLFAFCSCLWFHVEAHVCCVSFFAVVVDGDFFALCDVSDGLVQLGLLANVIVASICCVGMVVHRTKT